MRTRGALVLGSTVALGAIASVGMAAGGPTPPGDEIPGSRLIRVPGTSTLLNVWEAPDPHTGLTRPHYSISFDGQRFTEPVATSYTLKLRYGDFDPLGPATHPLIDEPFAAGEDTNLYIVQFVTQPLQSFRDAITAMGGTVHYFLANHSHIVRMDPAVRDRVEQLPYVRWVGAFHPAYRLEEVVLDNAVRLDELFPDQRWSVMVMESGLAQKQAVADRIVQLGGTVHKLDAGKYTLTATLNAEQLFAVTRADEIAFIDRWGPMENDMGISRDFTGADYVENQTGFTGQGVRAEVLDSGFNPGHTDFASRPLIVHGVPVDISSHGASTSGICFGDGTSDPTARGLLPSGQGIIADYQNATWLASSGAGQNRYTHTGELLNAPYFAVFQTCSAGNARTTQYTTISADHDGMLFDFDILHCQSQSNAGNQNSRPQAWAKNIISGGGIDHVNTLTRTDDNISGASTGPAADGRIKPTLSHFYDNIRTVTCCGATSYTNTFGGTSGATPNICGATGIFFQMWSEGIFGNPTNPMGTVFENRPHMTTAKAAMINSAEQYDWISGPPANAGLNRFRQGWGTPNLQNLYDARDRLFFVDESDVLANMQSIVYPLVVEPGEPAFKATMTYADPAGVPFSSQHRINDLTLKVTSPSGREYWGNNGLTAGLWSTPGGFANTIDTVENVFVQNPEAGTWRVEVIASEINQDSHVETPALDADFALVVSGVLTATSCTGDINGDLVVDVLDLLELLANWGPCPGCAADINGDGVVDVLDLLELLANWGPC